MRRNISALSDDYDNDNGYYASLIGAGHFTINDAVDYDNNFDHYADFDNYVNDDDHANGDCHTDSYTDIYGHSVEFGGRNFYFAAGHTGGHPGGDANSNKPERIGNVAVDPVIGLRQDLQRMEDSCICHHPVCRCGGNLLPVSSSPTRN